MDAADLSRWFRPSWTVATLTLALVLLASALAGCRDVKPARENPGPRIVILAGSNPAKVWTIDPSRREVISKVKLRSNAALCDVDANSGAIVTGQCGGLEQDADDVAGIVEPGGGRARYAQLKTPNPVDVAVVDGVAVMLHGFERREGVVASSVDVKSGKLITEGFMRPYPQRIGRSGNRIFMTSAAPSDSPRGPRAALYTVQPRTLREEKICELGLWSGVPIADEQSTLTTPTVLVIGFADNSSPRGRALSSQLLRVDLRSKKVIRRVRLRGLKAGAFEASVRGDRLAVLDTATAAQTAHDGVIIYDYPSCAPIARVANGSPGDVLVAAGEVHVADIEAGVLKHYSKDGKLRGITEVGDLGVAADLNVIGEP
ncbi:MAG: hypothetical protein HY876_09465 [Coriobacteriales bacterium]|nr:hypothetical protein [Coriobacteriales bacterium]